MIRSLKPRLRAAHRAITLRRSLAVLSRQPRGSPAVWRSLEYGWGNESFSASPAYLDAVVEAALDADGPILECGSGLTTLVLATIRRRTGASIWALEDDPEWVRKVRAALHRHRLAANVFLAPLRDYGDFDWYEVAPSRLPKFSLVVCDGPMGSTRGGRLGLLPVLGDRLGSGCVILLDDAGRPDERQVLKEWEALRRLRWHVRDQGDDDRLFAVVSLDASGDPADP